MEYERLYSRARVSAAAYAGPEEFIKYEICCEEKHGDAICDAKFTSRTSVYRAPFKGFRIHSYGAHMSTLCVSNCIDITSPPRPMFGIVHLRGKQSRLLIIIPLAACLNATRVEWQIQCNDHANSTDILVQTRHDHTFQFCMSNTYKRAVILNYKGPPVGMFAITRTFITDSRYIPLPNVVWREYQLYTSTIPKSCA